MVYAHGLVAVRVVRFKGRCGEVGVRGVVGDELCAARVEGEGCVAETEVEGAGADEA